MFVVKDTSYNLSKIEKLIEERDIFIPLKKTYEIKFAPLSSLAEQIEDILSDKGTLEIKEETFRFTVIDAKKNLDIIDTLVKKEDILERQLISPVQFEEESLKNVLSLFSDEVRINMFVSPEVEGEVTLRLGKPTPFLDALEAVLMQNYCQYEIEDNIIMVSKMPIFSKSFSLEYALASSITSSVNALISSEGSLHLDEATNTIIVSDKKEKIEEIAAFIAGLDTPAKQLQSKSFSVEFILADEVASLLEDYLSAEGKIEVDPLANTLLLTETSRNFVQLEKLLSSLDIPDRQISEKSFSAKYLYLEELANLVEEELSPLGEKREDKDKAIVIVKDSLYNLSKIEKLIEERDVFIPLKKTYEIKFAPLSSLAEEIEDILSEEGRILETREDSYTEDSGTIAVEDVQKNLDRVDELVSREDTLEAQLIRRKRYVLKYLTPYEAKYYLEVNNVVNEHGKIHPPKMKEKEEVGNVKAQSDYIIIPQETVGNPEEIEVQSTQVDLPEEEENVIYITDLKRNIPKIDETIEEMNSPSRAEEMVAMAFNIPQGSLESIVIAMAYIIGMNPEDIQGIKIREGETEWIKMKVASPTIDLGDIGAVGRK